MLDFFINRPIFAMVIAILMVILGVISILVLPVAQYPSIVPPSVQVTSQYVGASADVVSKTVTTPLESSINGVEGMIYMSSASTNSGSSVITITFDVGYDINNATVDVLNATTPAKPLLPESVLKAGLNIQKVSSNIVLVVNLISPNGTFDEKYLGNYADIHITDVLSRIPGVGNVNNFGLLQYSIRVWLDPDKLNSMEMTVEDVISAIEEQNQQAPVGYIGQPPVNNDVPFQYQISTLGQLKQVEQFEDIIVRVRDNNQLVYLKDIAKVELGAQNYSSTSKFDGNATASLGVFQLPGSNSIQLAKQVRESMKKLKNKFPEGMDYIIAYDTTEFVTESLKEVVITLLEAMALVFIVVFVFLQNWRATLIPGIAIPVSLIGTFALLLIFGFSINTLSLLGLVLAIGLVVDDAIVVVENVERKMEGGITDLKEATLLATKEVRGPIIATTLILMAVFVPVAFIPGMTGSLYNQFSLAIAFSVALSGINSLTLSPALCALLLKPKKESRFILFRWFEDGFNRLNKNYTKTVTYCINHSKIVLLLFVMLGVATYICFSVLPTGFIPEEDQGYFMVIVEGPEGSSLSRTETTAKLVEEVIAKTPGVAHYISINGYNIIDGISEPNMAVVFVTLKNWSERTAKNLSAFSLIKQVNREFMSIKTANVMAMNAPSIPGLGTVSGFQMEIQDLGNVGVIELAKEVDLFLEKANSRPELKGVFSDLSVDTPQLFLDIDRTKVKALDISMTDLFATLQIYLGSYYVNNFNKYGKTYQVIIQAESDARSEVEDINKLYVRSQSGAMVPLSSFVKINYISGAFNIPHYNLYNAASVNGGPAPGYSSGEAMAAIEEVANEALPSGIGYEWTGITYQQLQAGNVAPLVFMLCLVFVFLFLAALYESWSMPFMILLAVPLALLGASLALLIRGLDLNIYAQIGLILLIGLAAKNAILIVEFAKDKREQGMDIVEAAVQAATLRLRPILMTALAFILGVLPLAIATGAGANSRHSIGTTVMGGMLVATVLSLIIVPVFYVVIEKLRERKSIKNKAES